jgi:hypothetical protein
MKKAPDCALEDLRHLATLRALAPELPAANRRALDSVVADLTARIGPIVPKRRAAALLGISVQALDLWIQRDRIKARRAEGATRTGIDTDSLVWTANQITPGTPRPGRVVDLALKHAAFWRFNEAITAADGRAFAALPFATRIEQLDALNASMAELDAIRLRPPNPAEASHGT